MIYFMDSPEQAEVYEAVSSEPTYLDKHVSEHLPAFKNSSCAKYEDFFKRCEKSKSDISSRIEKLNKYFKNKYPDFEEISLFETTDN